MKRAALFLLVLMVCLSAAQAETLDLEAHFPGHTYVDGHVGEKNAVMLLKTPEGSCVLAGCELTQAGWQVTHSTPMPAQSSMEPRADGGVTLYIPLRTGADARENGVDMACTVQLVDGVWRLTQLHFEDRVFQVRDCGYFGTWAFYGDVTFETDVTRIDWLSIPTTVEQSFAALDLSAWRVVGRERTALYERPDAASLCLGRYEDGTPVRICAQQEGWAQVAILGGDVTGWMQLEGMESADTQMEEDGYIGWWNPWWLPEVEITPDMAVPVLYDAPDGEVKHALTVGGAYGLSILGACGGGWYHAAVFSGDVDGYVHVDELPSGEPFVLAAQLMPDDTYHAGKISEDAAWFMMTKPDGTLVFVGCEAAEQAWRITQSTPLPEDVDCDSYHASGSSVELCRLFMQDDEEQYAGYIVELQEDGRWLVTMTRNDFGVVDFGPQCIRDDFGTVYYGDVQIERDITRVDWLSLPTNFEEAIPLVDASAWAVVAADDTPLMEAPDAQAARLGGYCAGAPVRVLDMQSGWTQVAILGGDTIGWMPSAALLRGEAQLVWDEEWYWHNPAELPYVELVNEAAVLRESPDGVPCAMQPDRFSLPRLMGTTEDGWCHVYDWWTGLQGYLRAEDVQSSE
ncbi:MAG: SH3 domain-containing protein [Clostridia bacterium]|nr:SH3 domain-containing protein [Clostridia bacterium]